MVYVLKVPSVAKGYEEIVQEILEKGEFVLTENGELTKELTNVVIDVVNPNLKRISSKYPFGEGAIKEYIDMLLNGTENEFSYDYHSRLFDWGFADFRRNQVEYVVDKLSRELNSRRAVMITWNPLIDCRVESQVSVPCLQYIQFLVRDNKFKMFVLFRSNDMLLAFHSNALGLIELGRYVMNCVEEKCGVDLKFDEYVHYVVSAHIYVKRDYSYIEKYFPKMIFYCKDE